MSSAISARFELATAARIIFGPGTLRELGSLVRPLGTRALLVTGQDAARSALAVQQLAGQGMPVVAFAVAGEPTTHRVSEGLVLARRERCDLVVAMGGGSVLDSGKAIGALLTNGGELLDYLEVVGKARPLARPSVPVIAIPTTAGTGCEVTRNAVLTSPEHRFKVSLRSPLLLPAIALVDPDLTLGVPRPVRAATGLDALSQLIEPFVSIRANPVTDAFCREGVPRVARSLRRVCDVPQDAAGRADLALASLLSGLALANAGLGAVHGLAAPLGGMHPAPHGALCAALLPGVMEANLQALQTRSPDHPARARYDEVGRLLTGRAEAQAMDGIHWVRELCRDLCIPPLRAHGITAEGVPALVDKARQASSMKANPIELTPAELGDILRAAL